MKATQAATTVADSAPATAQHPWNTSEMKVLRTSRVTRPASATSSISSSSSTIGSPP
jgi:hypothetical protein